MRHVPFRPFRLCAGGFFSLPSCRLARRHSPWFPKGLSPSDTSSPKPKCLKIVSRQIAPAEALSEGLSPHSTKGLSPALTVDVRTFGMAHHHGDTRSSGKFVEKFVVGHFVFAFLYWRIVIPARSRNIC